MTIDFKASILRCHLCLINKQHTTIPDALVTPLPVPREPFSSIAIYLAGPFPSDIEKELILVVLDRFTGFPYLTPVSQNITGVETANLLIERIFPIHGFPTSIVSDRDPKFTSCFCMKFMAKITIDLNMAIAYHHQTNGQTERRIRTLPQCLHNFVNSKGTNWTCNFPHFHTAINAAPGDSSEL